MNLLGKWPKCCRYVAATAVILLAGFSLGVSLPTKWHYPSQRDCRYPVWVSSVNQFHTEIILPATNDAFDWRSQLNLNQLGAAANTYRYLSFGWGDRAFFQEASFDPVTLFDALFLPGPTTLHVWGHSGVPQLGRNFELKQLWLSRAQYQQLNRYIAVAFQRDAQGKPRYIRTGLYPSSEFYEALGTYSVLHTCNDWTAAALRTADVNTPHWAALAPAIMGQLRNNCSRQAD
jgi:uncharacterized protein (TIGR02117 family)